MKNLLLLSIVAFTFACGNQKDAVATTEVVEEEVTEAAEEIADDTVEEVEEAVEEAANYRVIGVVHVADEGCKIHIHANLEKGSADFYPVNLDEKFKRNGMKLKFAFEPSKAPLPAECSSLRAVSVSDVTIMR